MSHFRPLEKGPARMNDILRLPPGVPLGKITGVTYLHCENFGMAAAGGGEATGPAPRCTKVVTVILLCKGGRGAGGERGGARPPLFGSNPS